MARTSALAERKALKMNTKKMLEFAAKAAGIDYHATSEDGTKCIHDGRGYWNPIQSDGDAMRLMVRLRLHVSVFDDAIGIGTPKCGYVETKWVDDPYAATRLAIVRAATEIGRNMK